MLAIDTDRIEKEIVLRAPRSRVWRALTDAKEFGQWFKVELKDTFVPGAPPRRITHPGYEHVTFEVVVERMEPERLFSFRWHPYAVDPKQDYRRSRYTGRVRAGGGPRGHPPQGHRVRLRPDPARRRAEAFRMNSQGWAAQSRTSPVCYQAR